MTLSNMSLGKAFTKEETERLLAKPEIRDDFFRKAQEVGFEAAANHIRSTYWEIETHATRLRRMAKGWMDDAGGAVIHSLSAKQVLASAADELDRLKKFSIRRPISELRQESFKGRPNGPDRWVVLWGPSGYAPVGWRCAVGQRRPSGTFVTHSGDRFTDGGPEATHFSELPDDEAP